MRLSEQAAEREAKSLEYIWAKQPEYVQATLDVLGETYTIQPATLRVLEVAVQHYNPERIVDGCITPFGLVRGLRWLMGSQALHECVDILDGPLTGGDGTPYKGWQCTKEGLETRRGPDGVVRAVNLSTGSLFPPEGVHGGVLPVDDDMSNISPMHPLRLQEEAA
jgi:hypothetical protein